MIDDSLVDDFVYLMTNAIPHFRVVVESGVGAEFPVRAALG